MLATDGVAGDYASSFEITTDSEANSAQWWARSIFEGAPAVVRWFLIVGWKAMLRLRLGPRDSPDHVLGWTITTATPDTITLRVRSSLVTAHKVIVVNNDRLTVTTVVRYERPRARWIWSAIAPVHHRMEPLLITRAARR